MKQFLKDQEQSMILLQQVKLKKQPSSGKLYHHKMKLGRIKDSDDQNSVYERLFKRHSKYLEKIQKEQIINLLIKILKKIKTTTSNNLNALNKKSTQLPAQSNNKQMDAKQFYKQYENKDLNKLNEEELIKEKQKMDTIFNQNFKKPGDVGYKYDVQKDFKPSQDNEWDEDDDYDEDEEIDEYL